MTTTAASTGATESRPTIVSPADRFPRRDRTAVDLLPATEIALAAVTLAVGLGFGRLFSDGGYFGPVVLVAVVAHGAAALCRRHRVNGIGVTVVAIGGFAVLAGWFQYGDTLAFGLPTTATFSAARADLAAAWEQFGRVRAPAPAEPGFVLAAALALWATAWFSDWAAFRLSAPIEATMPAGALFLFTSMLGGGNHRVLATMAFALAVLAFVVLYRAMTQARSRAWLGGAVEQGTRWLVGVGVATAVIAVLVGVIAGRLLPGATSPALVGWRGEGGEGTGTRVTVSPLVDIRARLVDQETTEVFTVRTSSPEGAYWRLTALDRFDGEVWSSSGSFGDAEDRLAGSGDGAVRYRSLTQRFDIKALETIWAPSAFEAYDLRRSGAELRWDRESSTLIVDSERATSDELTYQLVSKVPVVTEELAASSDRPVPDDIAERYLELPDELERYLAQARAAVGAEALRSGSVYEKALALQNWFRDNFTYDLTVDAGHGQDAIASFLVEGRGYCEQFAGTYAAFARLLGIPARVAVGFTPGETDPDDPQLFRVRGKNAHAWPEVHLGQLGWLAFEPTPGRGAPQAAYTGVPAQQADQPPILGEGPGASQPEPEASETSAPASQPLDRGLTDTVPTEQLRTPGDEGSDAWYRVPLTAAAVVALAAVVYAIGAVVVTARRRRHRRRRATSAGAQVRLAWTEGTEAVAVLGPVIGAWETHDEFARRAGPYLDEPSRLALGHLATSASSSTYSGRDPDDEAAADARTLARRVGDGVRSRSSRVDRIRALLHPRAAFGGRPAAERPSQSPAWLRDMERSSRA